MATCAAFAFIDDSTNIAVLGQSTVVAVLQVADLALNFVFGDGMLLQEILKSIAKRLQQKCFRDIVFLEVADKNSFIFVRNRNPAWLTTTKHYSAVVCIGEYLGTTIQKLNNVSRS